MKKECLSPLSINLKTVSPRGVDAPLRPPAPKQHQGASSPGCGESHQLTSDDSFGSAWRNNPFPREAKELAHRFFDGAKLSAAQCAECRTARRETRDETRDEENQDAACPDSGDLGKRRGGEEEHWHRLGHLVGSVFAVCAVVTWLGRWLGDSTRVKLC